MTGNHSEDRGSKREKVKNERKWKLMENANNALNEKMENASKRTQHWEETRDKWNKRRTRAVEQTGMNGRTGWFGVLELQHVGRNLSGYKKKWNKVFSKKRKFGLFRFSKNSKLYSWSKQQHSDNVRFWGRGDDKLEVYNSEEFCLWTQKELIWNTSV